MLPAPVDMDDLPPDLAILVVDIVGYSKVPETAMPGMRAALDNAVAETFTHIGLAALWADERRGSDTGDGWIRIVPAAKVVRLVDPGIALLEDALRRHDRARRAHDPVLRTRLSIHLGPLSPDHRGDAINDACRLVDSEEVRVAADVAAEHESFVAAILSDEVYRRAVAAARTYTLAERDFLEVSAVVPKKQFRRTSWVHVPRLAPVTIKASLGRGEPPVEPAPSPAPGPQLTFNGSVGTAIGTVATLNMGGVNLA
ncbi:hypothetical protein ACFVUY_06235 [Kitasatospora sp. NPDC058063]|uniref:hypothetical protein n=1 Tax=unclassified Kitasatospora TaxID=2633591 RepID=UPI0036DD40DC